MTSGSAGNKVNISATGGATAFSLATDTASLIVDYTGPRVTGTTPALTGGTLTAGTTTLSINFNQVVIGANIAANYQLQSAGPDGLLGTADDVMVPLTASYTGTTATLTVPPLPENVYRLTVDDAIVNSLGTSSTAMATAIAAATGLPISWSFPTASCFPIPRRLPPAFPSPTALRWATSTAMVSLIWPWRTMAVAVVWQSSWETDEGDS